MDGNWVSLGECGCCGSAYGYYPYYPYYAGRDGGGGGGKPRVDVCCCPNPVPEFLFATIDGCDGGTYPLDGEATGSGGGSWNSGPGHICPEIGTVDVLITFKCADTLGPDQCTFQIFFNDVAQGPYSGTLVSCDPFLWISDPINLDAFGCTCGDFTVTITE